MLKIAHFACIQHKAWYGKYKGSDAWEKIEGLELVGAPSAASQQPARWTAPTRELVQRMLQRGTIMNSYLVS